ncbi:hypothetical protein H5410_018163 [Solanum commersonii]|uniref:NAC domain-containing protein n=1 Tax=Solanum commersonii TaxID=4109 RepID=A0A9J6A225_SOLCO|nr:hypothetical protein H5410_018163 [Solanum commersonii]
MSKQMEIRFHPTDTELIKYLKRFFKGELSLNQQCPIQFADIYGDQPPWEIFGANFEEKFRYFITSLKKQKTEYKRFSRICAKGTWKGQTGEHLIRRNHTAPVVGFKRNLKFETSECGQKNTWLMVEYHVADSFFKENNHILKEDFVVCRIKKKKMGIIDPMLLEPNHNKDYSTREDQVRVCDEVEATTTEFDVQNSTYEATTMEKRETTLEVEESHGVDDIRSDEFQEEMYRAFEDIPFDIPDDWLRIIFESTMSYLKQKTEYKRFSRICAKGTWKGQIGEHLIRRNRAAPVVGFKRNLKFETSECGQKNTWLMVEYHVTDSFFKENNHILEEDFVVCRIKKKMGKEKNVDHVMEAQDGDVAGIIEPMLLEPNHNNDYSTRKDQVRVCDEQDAVEATATEFDVPNSTYEATIMEKRETTLEVEEGHRVDDIRSDEFQEEMYRAFEDILVDIPDDWLQNSTALQDI